MLRLIWIAYLSQFRWFFKTILLFYRWYYLENHLIFIWYIGKMRKFRFFINKIRNFWIQNLTLGQICFNTLILSIKIWIWKHLVTVYMMGLIKGVVVHMSFFFYLERTTKICYINFNFNFKKYINRDFVKQQNWDRVKFYFLSVKFCE